MAFPQVGSAPAAARDGRETLGSVLIVDDSQMNRTLLSAYLASLPCRVRQAVDGESALAAVRAEPPDLILLDVMMPPPDGFAVTERLKAAPDTATIPIVLVTTLNAREDRLRGLEAGADDFLTKPVDRSELQARVRTHLRLKRLREERESQARAQSVYVAVVKVLAAAIEARDPYTGGHVERVAAHSVAIGRELGWDAERLLLLELGAMLHDVGKIGVDDRVLRKTGSLDPAEQAHMSEHPLIGARLLQQLPFTPEQRLLDVVLSCALHHQERYDGQGYPGGLAGENIPFEARTVAVADAFDAMTTTRPYRTALPINAAVAEIEREAGQQIDPTVVAACLRAVRAGAIAVGAR